MLVDFCLPIKNEALILNSSLNKLLLYCRQANFNYSWRIIGVINGSDDNSLAILQDFKRRYPDQVDFIEVKESGRGRALKIYWSNSSADIVSYMDSDLAVSLDNLTSLISPLINNEADLIIGSRLSKGASTQRSLFREIISQAYNLLSRIILKHRLDDLQCGFKAIRRKVFHQIYPYLADDYWFFDTELTLLSVRFGFRVKQIPVDWKDNRFARRPSRVKVLVDSWKFIKDLVYFRKRLSKLKNISVMTQTR